MYKDNFHLNISTYSPTSSSFSEKWSKHNNTIKKSLYQMEDVATFQDNKRQFYGNKNYICNFVRNVSSIELEKLLCENNSSISFEENYHCEDSDNCLESCTKILNYRKFIVQRCQNKGCMCKPIIDGKPKCQVDEATSNRATILNLEKTEEIRSVHNETKIQIKSLSESTHHKCTQIRKKSVEEISNIKPVLSIERNPEKPIEDKLNPVRFTQICVPSPCRPCTSNKKLCLQPKFEQVLEETGDVEFDRCENTDFYICNDEYTRDAVKTVTMVPCNNNVFEQNSTSCTQEDKSKCGKCLSYCKKNQETKEHKAIAEDESRHEGRLRTRNEQNIRKEREPEIEPRKYEATNENKIVYQEHEVKEENKIRSHKGIIEDEPVKEMKPIYTESSASTLKGNNGCYCFKKKAKKGSEKCIQTYNGDYTNKICQKGVPINCVCTSAGDQTLHQYVCTNGKIRSIWVCRRCGKVYNGDCAKYDKISRNTIILPSTNGAVVSSDQTETLRTLIKMEAKQNYRQIDNILQELNEQRNEIKRLTDLYQSITNDTKGKIKSNYIDDIRNTQKIYICEGCEIDINKDILKNIRTKTERNRSFDNGYIAGDEWNSYHTHDDYKYLKKALDKKKYSPVNSEKEIQTKNLVDKDIQTRDTKQVLVPKNYFVEDDKRRKQRTKRSNSILSTDSDSMESEYSNKLNYKEKIERSDHLIETEKSKYNRKMDKPQKEKLEDVLEDEIEGEKTPVEKVEVPDEVSGTQSNQCPFINWCKKSITSLKGKRSKDILKFKYECVQRKFSECKKSLSNLKDKQNDNEVKCDYQYLQDKINEVIKSLTCLQQEQVKDEYKCYHYLHNKMTQCTEKVKSKSKKNLWQLCTKYCRTF